MKSRYQMLPHHSNDTSVKRRGRVRLARSAVCALGRSFALVTWFVVSLAALSAVNAAESNGEAARPRRSQANQKGIRLEAALPFKFDGYTIGSPAERNNFPGVYSGISDPETVKLRGFYSISCSPIEGGDIKVYRKWNKGPVSNDTWPIGAGYSISVIYFIDDNKKQYIYGMISNTRALTNGVPIIVERQGWNCALSNS